MRICIINEFFYPDSTGGTGNTLSDLARSLADNHEDLDIDVITSTNLYRKAQTELAQTENWDGIKINRLRTTHPNGLSLPGRLIANLQFTLMAFFKLRTLGKYDMILVATAPPMVAFAASLYKSLTGTPFVYIIYDLEPDRSVTLKVMGKNHPFVQIFMVLQRSCLVAASRIVALGDCMRDYVVDAYKLPVSKFDVIHIGSNEGDVTPGPRISKFRDANKIDGFVILYSGNFGRYHNFDTVLDAAKSLNSTHQEIQFVLVGDGAQKSHIIQRIADEHIVNVRVFDFVPMSEYSDLLATADVSLVTLEAGMEKLCLPSKFYKLLASERPVIGLVSPESDVARVINRAKCGYQIDQGDSAKLVEVLQWFVDHPDERQQMGLNAREVFLGHFGTNAIAAQYYRTLLAAVAPTRLSGSRNIMSENKRHDFTGKSESLEIEKRKQGEPAATKLP